MIIASSEHFTRQIKIWENEDYENFSHDEAPRQTLGDGVSNVWFAAKPDYTIMLVNAQLVGLDGKSYKSDYTEGIGKTTFYR